MTVKYFTFVPLFSTMETIFTYLQRITFWALYFLLSLPFHSTYQQRHNLYLSSSLYFLQLTSQGKIFVTTLFPLFPVTITLFLAKLTHRFNSIYVKCWVALFVNYISDRSFKCAISLSQSIFLRSPVMVILAWIGNIIKGKLK